MKIRQVFRLAFLTRPWGPQWGQVLKARAIVTFYMFIVWFALVVSAYIVGAATK